MKCTEDTHFNISKTGSIIFSLIDSIIITTGTFSVDSTNRSTNVTLCLDFMYNTCVLYAVAAVPNLASAADIKGQQSWR